MLELQTLQSAPSTTASVKAKILGLREKVPAQVLAHCDNLMTRGKKGIVPVRNQNCTGCHMSVPLGTIMALRHAEQLQKCGNCGRYLYLPEDEETGAPKTLAKTKRRRLVTTAPDGAHAKQRSSHPKPPSA